MTVVHGFAPLVGDSPHTLILGSMPGVASLTAGQYYAHPRNAFWPIMTRLFPLPANAEYAERVRALTAAGVAVWDVLELCTREGSLDSAIESDTVVPNDIDALLAAHPTLDRIVFNGAAAARLFDRHVALSRPVETFRLPSTSPAHAALSTEAKVDAWRVVARDDR
ncbi:MULTISPECIES: DNA-deoxyinosine glycosylase [Nocardiaceae]|uniref:Hypoxanthine-DNA glycosylase n=1 Tax=Rhodococcoides corynebacterioides TaxID=53972 RepID=A0ABS2KR37_9NOCA|nr:MULTISPECIES: DNA-deoxyinosine glycosylase [Rhodococcus]MBM7414407.1 hypoxanthine-DNA glycosylase [Rhodococcus corynebacterioides]MBP1116870.1 hypoxanthine-DNA glycosylase [Rhodococcus sp. PvP016]